MDDIYNSNNQNKNHNIEGKIKFNLIIIIVKQTHYYFIIKNKNGKNNDLN